jgi:uncharacterized Ntn-hydrolase superfamily protein
LEDIMHRIAPFLIAIAIALPTAGVERPVHTYSIVARDEATGQMGVAVQSHWFSVGSIVTWAEAGVGAIATQSFVDPAYGPRGLELMKSGLSAEQALDALLLVDEGRDVRQVAFVDTSGRVAAHTGAKCIEAAGHHAGEGFSVQANMMLNDEVVPAMAKAYESTEGDLAERLMAALEAAQSVGGDIRGKQSAAMLIVKSESTGRSWADRVLELRIEDHPTPIVEMRRLLRVHRAYEHMNAGDLAVEHEDLELAMAEYGAAAVLLPGNVEVQYWAAVTLATSGKLEQALPIFRTVFAISPPVRLRVLQEARSSARDLLEMHVGLRVRNRAPCSFEPLLELAGEVELETPVVGGVAPGAHQQVHRRVAEVGHRDQYLRFRQHAFIRCNDRSDGVHGGLDVVVVRDAHHHVDAAGFVAIEVLDRRPVDLPIGDGDSDVVGALEGRREDANLFDRARRSSDIDEVSQIERSEEEQHHTGGEVGKRALQRKTDGEAGGTEDCDHRGRRHPEPVERGDHHHREDRVIDQLGHEGDERGIHVAARETPGGDLARPPGHHATDD